MHSLIASLGFFPWRLGPMELRIDVAHPPDRVRGELDTLYRRLQRTGDALHGLPRIGLDFPGLVFHYRVADGEHYVYVEDPGKGCLAGYTVFNRLVELDRRADRRLRAPHSKYAPAYQRRGIATAVYRWWLERGNCLISGARQSVSANALWHALARRHERVFVELRDKRLRLLGHRVDSTREQDLHTRMLLLGRDWDLARLAGDIGMIR